MNTTRFLTAALTVLLLASASQAVVTLLSTDPVNDYYGIPTEGKLLDGILAPPVDPNDPSAGVYVLYGGITAVYDLGAPSTHVTGALVTLETAAAAGIFNPGSVEFYFSNTLTFNPTPDVSVSTESWPQADGWSGWPITTQQADASGTARYLQIVLTGNGAWLRPYELAPIVAGNTWPDYLPGDFNKDGEVGPEDFGILKDNFGLDSLPFGNHESWTLGDANDDGEIGPEDFGMLKDNFGLDGGPTGTYPLANVPEPTTLALLALGGLLAARRNRR
ncbi:MAG: PEP-CTERM sorting domain-containing protein [Planctomycetota bacterium]|nr:PEP-CTERM sorting domain-containing protein [Planctomycetota bacterium]